MQLNGNPVSQFSGQRDEILGKARDSNLITDSQFGFLKLDHPVTPVFFILSKIHKNPSHPPGRPVGVVMVLFQNH